MGGLAVASGIVDAGGLVDGDEAERWVTIRSSRSWAVFGIYQYETPADLGRKTKRPELSAGRGTLRGQVLPRDCRSIGHATFG